jgi:hypothetical protein
MELTIATLNEILLSPFLFIVTFCFLCCQLPRTRCTNATQRLEAFAIAIPQPQDEAYSVEEILPVIQDEELQAHEREAPAVDEPATPSPQPDTPAVEDLENVPVEKDAPETVTSAEPVPDPQPGLYDQALAVIDNLGKREARKLMGGLKLQQKRNGVELSTELMVASIRREFKVDPERVIEVIRERLPELLPANSDPQQLAS